MRTLYIRLSRLACCVAVASTTLAPVVVAATDATPAATAAKATVSQRAPDAAERSAMLEILKGESAPERAAWLSYTAGNAEGLALADALAAVFREGGWK